MLQLMHAEAVRGGNHFQWANYFEPEPELVDRYEQAARASESGWSQLEPDYA